MACTTQTALDYVTKARCNLVRELRGLSIILENLCQQRVLSKEAVSKVQAEKDDYDKNRTMLDFVIQSGEEACYELLKIIYMTRKRNLRRDEASGETRRFDLHHWISCFSFKEDTEMDENYLQGPKPCHRYQKKLKSKAQKISKEFWTSSKTLFEENKKPVLSYTSLVLETQGRIDPSKIKKFKSKKSRMCRPKKLRTYVPENKLEISPSDLLKTHKNILLVGKPGIGKTALTLELLRLWSEGDSKELEYMFYFDMRETEPITSAKNLEDLLFSLYSEPDEGKDEVLQDIKTNSDNVTIIFDGLTDLSVSVVKRLVKKDLLPDAKIIMTCRPDDEDEDEDFLLEECLRVEVQGFSEQTIKTYLSATLGEDLEKVLSSVELLTLCHVPMYALMVAACFSSEDSTQPRTITEIYIHIVRFCLKTNNKIKNKNLDFFIESRSKEILSLAETAFHATQKKNVNLEKLVCEDSCVLSFLKTLDIKVDVTETITTHAFLHYTVQEFFAAVWLLKNPNNIRDVFQQCLTEEQKHMKHLIPFMCRLMNEKSHSLMSCLIPVEDNNKTSTWFFKEMITTFSAFAGTEDSRLDDDILFLCQCLYEYQCPEACIYLLDKLDFCLDLSGEKLDPYTCCAVVYVVTQSKESKIWLNLEDATVSEEGMRRLFGCLENVQWCDPLPRQLWKIYLLIGGQMDYIALLGLDGNQMHLPVDGKSRLFERAVKIIQRMTAKVNVCLHWDREGPVCQSLSEALFEVLPNINSLSFRRTSRGPGSSNQDKSNETLERDQKELFLDLCLRTALCDKQRFHGVVNVLLSFFPIKTGFTNILLDLYQHVKSKRDLSLLPSIQSVFQSAPAVWSIKLSERKTSILLEVLKLQSEKKQVELTDCSHEEREVRSFLQCLPYISQLSLVPQWSNLQEETRLFVNLFCAAAEREQQRGEKILKLLSSVLPQGQFPFNFLNQYEKKYDLDFLLALYSQMKDCETKTGLSLLPSLQSVFQSAPAVWYINLSERKTSIHLEVLKLQSEKKQVELTDDSHEEREVRSFLQCLPYISQLSCGPEFFQSVCSSIFVRSREDLQQLVFLLQLLDFQLLLTGELRRKTCCSVGRILRVWGFKVDLTLTPSRMSVRGAALLFRYTTQLHSLKLSNNMTSVLLQCVRRGRLILPLAVEELYLVSDKVPPAERVLLKVVSSLASLLRYWTVGRLDLTESCIPAQSLITLLLHDAPLTLRLSEDNIQQLLVLLHEVQDENLSLSFLSKISGDLTSCCLNWEFLHHLLQLPPAQTITVNLKKNHFLQETAAHLLPFLDRIVFKRPSPRFVRTSIREVYRAHASHMVPSLLRSLDHVINLNCTELDSVDCAALLFILKHSDRVQLKLLGTFIPAEEIKSILWTLNRVTDLSVDRNLLLRFIHCCAASDDHQEAASDLLRTLQHRLDLSCSSYVELPEEGGIEPLSLTAGDCQALCTILRHSRQDTQLHLQDCEVEDSGLDLLFPVLHRVRLRVSKTVLVQLLSLLPVNNKRDTVRRVVSLCQALGGELDLSRTTLDQRLCGALVQMLDFCEELTELDLSHCELTDQLLLQLTSHLHKVHVLDLSHNKITDASTDDLLQLVSINPSINTVRLFSNNIVNTTCFKKHKQFEMW